MFPFIGLFLGRPAPSSKKIIDAFGLRIEIDDTGRVTEVKRKPAPTPHDLILAEIDAFLKTHEQRKR